MILNKKFIKNNYLSNYDSINKYNLKNIYSVPKLKNIILEFSLKNLIKASDFTNISEENNIIQHKAFILFYLMTSHLPFINSNKLKIIKKTDKDGESFYALKLMILNKNDINNFLLTLFIENWQLMLIENIKIFPQKNFKAQTLENKLILNCNIPAGIFFEINTIFEILAGLNSKEFNFNTSFLFQKNFNLVNNDFKKFIKNLPFFWLIK